MAINLVLNGAPVQVEEFYETGSLGLVNAARACETAGYEKPTMPKVLSIRIAAPNDSRVWQPWNDSISFKITGRTPSSNYSRNGGTPATGYCHAPEALRIITLDYIERAINEGRLINGALPVSQQVFQAILDLTPAECKLSGRAFQNLISSASGEIPFNSFLTHPQVIPFCGSEDLAQAYLDKFRQVYPTRTKIGNWHYKGDLQDVPLVRPLCLGYVGDCLDANGSFDDDGRLFGVRPCAEGACATQNEPSSNPTEVPTIKGRELTLEERTILEAINSGRSFTSKGKTYSPLSPELKAALEAIGKGKSFLIGKDKYVIVGKLDEEDKKPVRARMIELD